MITWLIGKSSKVDLIWQNYKNEITKNLNLIQTINLFEEKKFKYIYDKKDNAFFKNRKRIIENEVIIKGILKFDKEIMNNDDIIIDVDSKDDKYFFNFFVELNEIVFTNEENLFISKLKVLEDLSIIIVLKKLEISQQYWNYFLEKEKDNWFKKLKEKTLLLEGLFLPTKIIPIMIYAINAKIEQKPNLLFIQSKIKQGNQIWQFTKLWKSCF